MSATQLNRKYCHAPSSYLYVSFPILNRSAGFAVERVWSVENLSSASANAADEMTFEVLTVPAMKKQMAHSVKGLGICSQYMLNNNLLAVK